MRRCSASNMHSPCVMLLRATSMRRLSVSSSFSREISWMALSLNTSTARAISPTSSASARDGIGVVLSCRARRTMACVRSRSRDRTPCNVAMPIGPIRTNAANAQTRTATVKDFAITFMLGSAKSLTVAVLVCAFAAFVLIGPIGMATLHGVLSRLRDLTQAMVRLARHDNTTPIPSRADADEVGEMARAVEVFKDNAIQLISRENELETLNRRIDVALNNMTHGLCMFDAEQRLIVCNATYLQMYGLGREHGRAGTPLQR